MRVFICCKCLIQTPGVQGYKGKWEGMRKGGSEGCIDIDRAGFGLSPSCTFTKSIPCLVNCYEIMPQLFSKQLFIFALGQFLLCSTTELIKSFNE